MPPLMVRGGVERSETEGIRGSEIEHTIPQSAVGCQLPLHKGAMVGGVVRCQHFAQGSQGVAGEVSYPPIMPPLMVRGGGAKHRRG